MERTKREMLLLIWKCFAFTESKLSREFVADLLHITEAQVEFILVAHKDIYLKIIKKNYNELYDKYK